MRQGALAAADADSGGERLSQKPARFAWAAESDARTLQHLLVSSSKKFGARRDIAREGDRPAAIYVMLAGWACRYKTLPDGRRQILAFLVPGDLCDPDIPILQKRDHSLGAITSVEAAEVRPDEFEALLQAQPGLEEAVRRSELVAVATQREWTLSLGQRTAYERIAHLMCELFFRLRATGRSDGSSCEFPVTQTDIADATGLTPVHVNRTVQTMRSDGLIELRGKRLGIPSLSRLMNAGLFDGTYLHLDGARAENG